MFIKLLAVYKRGGHHPGGLQKARGAPGLPRGRAVGLRFFLFSRWNIHCNQVADSSELSNPVTTHWETDEVIDRVATTPWETGEVISIGRINSLPPSFKQFC